MHVTGVHNTLRNTWNITTTVDCTYVAALLSYGVFGIIFWLMGYVLAFRRAWDDRKASIVAALVIFAVSTLHAIVIIAYRCIDQFWSILHFYEF